MNPYDTIFDPVNGIVYLSAVTPNLTEIQASSLRVLPTVPAGGPSVDLAFDARNGFLYVTGGSQNNTTVINTATNTIVTVIRTSGTPWGIAYDSADGDLYVANDHSNNVSVINGTTNLVVDTIPVGSSSLHVAFNPRNGDVYVTHPGSNSVSVINGTSNTVVATIPITTGQALGVAADPRTGEVYVASDCPNGVTVVNGSTNTAVNFLATGQTGFCSNPADLDTARVIVDDQYSLLYVSDAFSGTVGILNESSQSLAATITVGRYPVPMALDSVDSRVFVAKYGSTNMSVLGRATVPPSEATPTSTFLALTATQWFVVWVLTLVVAGAAVAVLGLRNRTKSTRGAPPKD